MPDRQVLVQQHRTLLDMHFQIADQILRPPRKRGNDLRIEPGRAHDVDQSVAFGVAPLEDAGVELAGDRAAADIRRGEAHALLLRERDQVDMERQLAAGPMQMLDHHQRGQNAEPSIVAAGIADGVVVRAEDRACAPTDRPTR